MTHRQADKDGICFSEPFPLHGLWANRHAWALRESRDLLAAALHKDTSAEAREVEKLPDEQIPAQVVRLVLEQADPTRNKGMTAWLVRQYGQGRLRLEDLGTANETLMMFQRYAPRLGPVQRDLGRYPHLSAVWEAVIGFANDEEQHLSGKAQKAMDRDKAHAESRILRHDPDGFTVAVPLTEFAAKWWGRGTRWCTAAEKNNRFWQYHKDAPLIVVVIPELKEKGKFQLWVTKSDVQCDVQFMDVADQSVSEVLITEYWRRFEPVVSFALKHNGWSLKYVPEAFRADEMCRIAAAQNGRALGYVPKKLRTEEMCRIAVAQNGRALAYVPEDLRTEELCRIAVAQNGGALRYVPEKFRTEDICKVAVAQDGYALAHVPEKLKTDEMCRIAVSQNGRALAWVPEKFRTEDICKVAVAQNGEALSYVPKSLRNAGTCRIAVAQNGRALEYVPAELRTNEMCRIAVAQIGWALEYVPDALCSEMQQFANVPQPRWDLSILDQWPEVRVPEQSLPLSGVMHA